MAISIENWIDLLDPTRSGVVDHAGESLYPGTLERLLAPARREDEPRPTIRFAGVRTTFVTSQGNTYARFRRARSSSRSSFAKLTRGASNVSSSAGTGAFARTYRTLRSREGRRLQPALLVARCGGRERRLLLVHLLSSWIAAPSCKSHKC